MSRCYALVDCNNFYASCERLFRPDLVRQPIVVLSNNDGCVVARSKEAKALGIPMAVPAFKIKDLILSGKVLAFSSNYPLYADVSERVIRTLESLAPACEVYSIDESFVDLTGVRGERLEQLAQKIRQRVLHWTGISVGIGIGPTKTLAKLANYAAKKYPATGGIVDLSDPVRAARLMALTPVDEVWGVGRRLARQLAAIGCQTAADLAGRYPKLIRQRFSVALERTVRELNGEPCFGFEQQPADKQQIICSRSFGSKITSLGALREAVSEFAARACEKLRAQRSYAGSVSVFVRSSPFAEGAPYYAKRSISELTFPCDDTRDILELALTQLAAIYREGIQYAKAGVMLGDFRRAGEYQGDLFCSKVERPHSRELMQTLDRINRSGRGRLRFACQGVQQPWKMRQLHLSPRYTTCWDELAIVR
ncbi:translesion error-prone DNA polymerase V subunit UmuC [Dongshaea marina]|uniref:translesion error-prone DNA polymerase V subunit UmuC n=1 Tax=Dongshaea marina TaxID=2047966 RepID=UPI000D3ED21B|nr:translesion error-prone DNA polymerase V subunit UmuC [Dongshaea marina]